MISHDQQYNALVLDILNNGETCMDRTGTGTKSVFGRQLRFDLREAFPLLTGKRVFFRGVIEELLWMLRGETNINDLGDGMIKIWDEWADADGNLGPIYGAQWRSWGGQHDQILQILNDLITNPHSRRHIVSAWNVGELDKMRLPPCHMLFQFHVNAEKELSCMITQRSADMFLGVPFNIASYAALTHVISWFTGYPVGDLIWSGGDCHVYLNHVEQMAEQLARPLRPSPNLTLEIDDYAGLEDINFDCFKLWDYNPHPALKGKVAV